MKNNLESNNTSNANTNPLGKDAQIEVTKQSLFKRYLIPSLIDVAMFAAMFFIKNPFTAKTAEDVFKNLCDDATVPAIILFCLWGFSFSASKGIFDGLSYSFKNIIGAFIPVTGLIEHKNYKDFKETQEKKRKKAAIEYLIVSGVFFILMIIFYVIYKLV